MDYQSFREKIGYLDVPDEIQERVFFENEKTTHFVLKHFSKQPMDRYYDVFANIMDVLDSRGAERGKDYIIVAGIREEEERSFFEVGIHMLKGFLSDEDFPADIHRK